MSLTRIAARIAAVQAIKGRTLVGDNVLDSEIGVFDINNAGELRSDQTAPFISVYTDDGKVTGDAAALRSLVGNGATDILFEAGIAATMSETSHDGVSTLIGVEIPSTDRNLEFYLDVVMRQISDALTDPENEWAQIFLGLTSRFNAVDRARTSSDAGGVRLAGQQLKLNVTLFNDPVSGTELKSTHPLYAFFEKLDSECDPILMEQLKVMKALIENTAFEWRINQRRYGMTNAEMEALLLKPINGLPDHPDFNAIDLELTNDPANAS